MSFDIVTYALLKKQIAAAAGGISDAKVENGHLILVGIDGTEYDCGDLGIPTLDDTQIATDVVWSSQKIVDSIPSQKTIEQIATEIAKENSIIFGGESYDMIIGGKANFDEPDTLIATGEAGES